MSKDRDIGTETNMNEDEEAAGVSDPSDAEDLNDSTPKRPHRSTVWRRLRWIFWRLATFAAAGMIVLILISATAIWYTSRPDFCRSCHIMEPYYVSWQNSSHKDVDCIKCHFAPGAFEKARGKLLGLVQLAKYVTSTEGPRPAAEIPDASCLRSSCHETRLLSGRVDFQGIPFDHAPHLENILHGKKLRCVSCHGQIVQGTHMAVTPSTCFLCHFKNGEFNQGLGACTRCHQIPKNEFELGGGVTFSHDLAYERAVDCVNCHGDLIRGNGEIPHERCQVCHNRVEDLERINDSVFMHATHVSDHKIDCLDCHLEIYHTLESDKLAEAVSNCTGCHPNHHREQVDLMRGVGGQSVSSNAGGMLATRLDCHSCHNVKEESVTGAVLKRGSFEVCLSCHDSSEADRLHVYHDQLEAVLPELGKGIQRARQALESAELDPQQMDAVLAELKILEDDLNFLQVANGIHNMHYAGTLTLALVDKLATLCRELQIDEPDITVPDPITVNGSAN